MKQETPDKWIKDIPENTPVMVENYKVLVNKNGNYYAIVDFSVEGESRTFSSMYFPVAHHSQQQTPRYHITRKGKDVQTAMKKDANIKKLLASKRNKKELLVVWEEKPADSDCFHKSYISSVEYYHRNARGRRKIVYSKEDKRLIDIAIVNTIKRLKALHPRFGIQESVW